MLNTGPVSRTSAKRLRETTLTGILDATMWADRKRLAVVAALFVAGCALIWFCLNLAASWSGLFLERNPVSVTFVGYTNRTAFMPGVGPTNVPLALFDVSNRSAVTLSWALDMEPPGKKNTSMVFSTRSPHSAHRIELFDFEGGGDWRFTVTLFRPRWQQRIGEVLNRVGLHPAIFAAEKVYPPITNAVTGPSGK
jgi:hypothetical protein